MYVTLCQHFIICTYRRYVPTPFENIYVSICLCVCIRNIKLTRVKDIVDFIYEVLPKTANIL